MELQLAAVEGVLEARDELAARVFWIGLAFADAAVAALTLLKSHEAYHQWQRNQRHRRRHTFSKS